MRYAFLIIAFLIFGCGSEMAIPATSNEATAEQQDFTDITPEGFKVSIPKSVYQHGIYFSNETLTNKTEIKAKILFWVDSWVNLWIDQNAYRTDPEILRTIASTKIYVVIDDSGFPCQRNETGFCTGDFSENFIYSSLYITMTYNFIPPYNYPPHALRTGTQMAEWLNNPYWLDKPYVMGGIGTYGLHSIPQALNLSLYGF